MAHMQDNVAGGVGAGRKPVDRERLEALPYLGLPMTNSILKKSASVYVTWTGS